MSNPVCIVTGASRGIGRATAIELSARGFDCVLVARTRDQLEAVANELRTRSILCAMDVTSAPDVARAVADALKSFGRIDAVVNNAGLAPVASIEETDDKTWHDVIDTNLSSAFYFAREAWAALKSSRGAIVNVGSEASRDPFPGFLAYATAKAGLNMLTQMLHREGSPLGIRAYCVAPAAVETAMFRAIVSEVQFGKDKTLAPEDVAKTIASCIMGDLRHASGETIYVPRT